MPSIFDCANHFDDIAATDGYTGAALFKVQTSTFLGASPDGSVSQKRIFSMAPALTMPARGCVVALGERYIAGSSILDGIYGQAIRRSYWAKMVTDLFEVLTPAQACLGTAGVTAYGRRDYLKDLVNSVTDSEYDPLWEIFFTPSEPALKGSFLKVGTTFYRIRSIHLDEAGFQNAASDEIDPGARVSAVFDQTGAYNPITDSYAAGSLTTTAFLVDRYKVYDLLSSADKLNLAGDMTLVVAASAVTPTIGRNVTIAGQSWQVLNTTPEQDAWALHVRRV
jgi:hypothetical protein